MQRRTPSATLGDLNEITGRAIVPPGRVNGVNPQKLSCDGLCVRGGIALLGQFTTRLTCAPGSANDPSLTFASAGQGTGLYGTAAALGTSPTGTIYVAIGGQTVCAFSSDGVLARTIRGPANIIDFGGSKLVNVGGIEIKPGVFDVFGDAVATIDGAREVVLTIPIEPPRESGRVCCAQEMRANILFAMDGANGGINGARDFRARMWIGEGETVPNVSAEYEIGNYCAIELASVAIDLVPVAGGVNIVATGIAGATIRWQARASVMRVECL